MQATPTSASLRLLTWLSPAFPTGGFAYSHGLEWVIESGDVSNGDALQDWLVDLLLHGAIRGDAILLRHTHGVARDSAAVAHIAELATASAASRERWAETLSQGSAFVRAASAWDGPVLPDPVAYPVAVGAFAGWHGIDVDATTAGYLQAVTANLISAAVRLVPLGQTTGLQVLATLESLITQVAKETRRASLDDIGGCVFRSDIAAMRHETQYTRLFRS